jgi:hypothetical protein
VCRRPTLKAWVEDLTLPGKGIPIHPVFQRLVHPGLVPLAGDGFLAALPGRQLDLPGSWAHCVVLLHWFERGEQGNPLAVEEQDSALGALLTLVTDRRCQVVPEVFAKVEGAMLHIAIPTYGQIDPTLPRRCRIGMRSTGSSARRWLRSRVSMTTTPGRSLFCPARRR